ncbi:unnamed protein product [Closterium sp. Naga37s-1]|nr:unnamed protein product [Closterium sp. Naga37s-1]
MDGSGSAFWAGAKGPKGQPSAFALGGAGECHRWASRACDDGKGIGALSQARMNPSSTFSVESRGHAGCWGGRVRPYAKVRFEGVGACAKVRFEGVNACAKVRFEGVSACAKVRVGPRGVPSLLNQLANHAGALLRGLRLLNDQRCIFFALDACSGILKPARTTLLLGLPRSGKSTLLTIPFEAANADPHLIITSSPCPSGSSTHRMTLLLGPPGSGKSTVLKILAGKAERVLGVQGEVTYNGRPRSQFVLPQSVAFVPQMNSHMGEMTVRETLEFSAWAR